jgi:predicted thioesterase
MLNNVNLTVTHCNGLNRERHIKMRDKQFRALTRSERIQWELTETVWGTILAMGYVATPQLVMWLERYCQEVLRDQLTRETETHE